MADEVVKVIKIEAQGSETTVKQLRQEISNLRDALLNTEKGSDQYKETVEKLTNTQNKLSEVLKAGKEVFVGSKQELKALKQQMDQLQEGTAEYNAAFQRAAEITHTLQERQELLKYSAADVGTQLQNMVSIGSSLAAGFNSINAVMALTGSKSEDLQKVMVKLQAGIALVQGLQGLEGMTKRMSGLVNGMTEMIFKTTETTTAVGAETVAVQANTVAQQANTVATAGATVATNAFKKALVATGIGAIVVLIGTLIAHWDDLKDMIGLSSEKLEQFGLFMDKAKAAIVGVANAIGNILITPIKNAITYISTLGNVIKDVFTLNFSQIGDHIKEGFSKIVDNVKKGYDIVGNYQEAYNKKSAQLSEKRAQEAMKASAEELNELIKDNEAKEGSDWKYTEEGKKMYDEYFQKKLAGYKKDSKEFKEAQREMWAYNRDYQKRIDDAKKAADEEEERRRKQAASEAKAAAEAKAREAEREAQEKEQERQKDIAAIEAFYKRSKDFAKEDKQRELDDLEEKYNTEKALLDERKDDFENYQEILTDLTAEYEAKRDAIKKKYDDAEKQKKADNLAKTSNKRLSGLDYANSQDLTRIELEYSWKQANGSLTYKDIIAENEKIYEANKTYLEEQLKVYESVMNSEAATDEQRIEAQENYERTSDEIKTLALKRDIQRVEEQKELVRRQIQMWTELGDAIADIFGSIADLLEEDIKNKVKNGELTQEEAEKQFEQVKALQIAQATIQTISGAIAAFMSCQELGFPWGTIIGAVQAAAVTAAGIAQIAQIKSTTLGGGGSSISSAAVATPVQTSPEEYVAPYTQNATGESELVNLANTIKDQKVYVVESDITEAQNRSKVRVTESTW